MIVDKRLERILPRVQKPARYVGGEYNAVVKDKAEVDTRIAFCFPDTFPDTDGEQTHSLHRQLCGVPCVFR